YIYSPVVDADGRVLVAASYRAHPSSQSWLSFFDIARGAELASVPLPDEDMVAPRSWDPSGGWLTGGYAGILLWPAAYRGSAQAEGARGGPAVPASGGNFEF